MMSTILDLLAGVLGTLILLLAVLRNSSDRKIQYFVVYGIYYFSIVISCLVTVPQSFLRPRNIKNLRLASTVCSTCANFMGIKWTLRNAHHIDKDRGLVVVSNHQSILDVIGMTRLWDRMGDCTAISKKELFYIPAIGLCGWFLGLVFINRKNPKEAMKIIENASKLMETEKAKLWIFPEGTRGDGRTLLSFKLGAFITAIRTQKPIVPIVFSPYRSFIDFENKFINEDRRMTISVLEEIPTAGLTDDDAAPLMCKIRSIMEDEFERLKAEAKPELAKLNRTENIKYEDRQNPTIKSEDANEISQITWAGSGNNNQKPPSFAGYNQKFR